jgi:hypothetical protein
MRYKVLQMFPRSRSGFARMRLQDLWTTPSASTLDTGFLQAWFEADPEIDDLGMAVGLNWGAISGLALSIAVSASFWAAVVWIAGRIW